MPTYPTQWNTHAPVTAEYDSATESYDGAELSASDPDVTYDGYLEYLGNFASDWTPVVPTYGSSTATKHMPIGLSLALTHTVQGSGGGGTQWTKAVTPPTNWSIG